MAIRKNNQKTHKDLIGLIPAAGTAERLKPLPCSKELFPVGFYHTDERDELRPKVVSHNLLEKMRVANVSKVYMILRNGKWDIPAYFGDGKMVDLSIAYLLMDLPFGVPFTIDQSYPFTKEAIILFGFPDILFEPEDGFVQLLNRQTRSEAEIVLGLFLSRQHQEEELVEMDKNGFVNKIEVKPVSTNHRYTWLIAVWTPAFTQFIHDYAAALKKSSYKGKTREFSGNYKEVFLGDVFNAALEADFRIDHVLFESGSYIDIGTPINLVKASRTIV